MRKGTTLSLFAASHPKDLAPTIPVIRKDNGDIIEFRKEDVQIYSVDASRLRTACLSKLANHAIHVHRLLESGAYQVWYFK